MPLTTRRATPIALLFAGVIFCLGCGAASAQNLSSRRPKLVLLVAIDQFRYDYLTRFRSEYAGGLRRLLDDGAVFVNANLEHYPTVTAVGHSTMLSGATPAVSGIIGNDWYDREDGKQVTSVSDDATSLLGAPGDVGASPHRLLVTTLGDELKRSGSPQSKVIGLSMKDRSAVLPAGRMADAAYWYDENTGAFISSTYYFPQLPAWVQAFNDAHHANEFAGKIWLEAVDGRPSRELPGTYGKELTSAVYGSPFGNDILEQFAETAVRAERLGQRGVTDVLAMSFSSNDVVGHSYGPDSPEAHAISLAVDRTLGRLIDSLDRILGTGTFIVALTADHGVGPVPEILAGQRVPGGRIRGDFFAPIRAALEARFGADNWLLSTAGSSPYLDYDVIARHRLDPAEVRRVAADAAAAIPHVARVYTRDQLIAQRGPADVIDARVLRSFNARRSGDLEVLLDPFWIRGAATATHGSPYNYDTHIPLVFMGPGIVPGRHYNAVALNDLAPTLAALLDIEPPSGSMGRILDEIFAPAAR